MTSATAFWTTAPGKGELRNESLPPPAADERRVRTLASGLSRGTEAIVFAGRVPRSQYSTMRAPLMAGNFPFPVKYGYAAVGIANGQRVFVLHPHQDVFNAPIPMCTPIPDAVPTHRAVLAANMETALNITWDAAALPGERITIIGAGVVGLLTAKLLAIIPGTATTIVDINPTRAQQATQFGCNFTTPDSAPADQDLIIHTSGTTDGLRLALARAAFEARIIEASWHADATQALPLGEDFHQRRLRLISSQVGAIAPAMRSRRSHSERLSLALSLLSDAACDTLLEPPTKFTDLPARMPALLAGGLCHVVTYGED